MSLSRADRSAYLLAGLLTTTGVLHFVAPGPFRSIVPKKLPARNALVAGSGVVELVCAGLVADPRTRRIGGVLTAATFIAVFPANVSMALRSGRRPLWYRAVAWLRLPGQVPLIGWALRVTETAPRLARSADRTLVPVDLAAADPSSTPSTRPG